MRVFKGMKGLTGLLAAAALLVTGCSSSQPQQPVFQPVAPDMLGGVKSPQLSSVPSVTAAQPKPEQTTEPTPMIVTPDHSIAGKVVVVNDVGQFVVLSFPVGQMPALQTTLQVYRRGLKVGELKVTGPQKDDHIVADIRAGECHVGDEVRDR